MFPLYDASRIQQLQHSKYLGACVAGTFDACASTPTNNYSTHKLARYRVDVANNCLLIELEGDGWNQVSHDIMVPGIGWISAIGVGLMRFRIFVGTKMDADTVHTYICVRDPIIHKNTRKYLQKYTGTPVASPPSRLVSRRKKSSTSNSIQTGEQSSTDDEDEEIFFEHGDEDIFTLEERECLLKMHSQQIHGEVASQSINVVK